MLERLRAERMAVADLDAEPLQEGRVDGFARPRRPRLGGMLGQLAGAGRLELLLGPNLDLVQSSNAVLGPAGRRVPRHCAVALAMAVALPMGSDSGLDHIRRMRLERLIHHQSRVDQAAF